MTAETPVGARLKDWWDGKKFVGGPNLDFDEMGRVALNVVPPEDDTPVSALKEALKAELSMFQAPEEQWDRVSGSLATRLESLGIILVRSGTNEGGTQ